MILDTDQQVQISIRDGLPITSEVLKEMGWKYVSSSSQGCGSFYVYWTIWTFNESYVQLYQDGRCFYNRNRMGFDIEVKTIKELRGKMHQYQFG